MSTQPQNKLANAIRFLSIDAVQQANSGHPGAPMGMADIAEVLWRDYLQHNPRTRIGPTVTALYCQTDMPQCCSIVCFI